jgi:spermidine/putrescine transport system substrate-binding protein
MTENHPPTPSPALMRGLLTRRTVMQGAGVLGAAAALAACGTKGAGAGAAGQSAAHPSASDRSDVDKTVNWSNWQAYIDVNDKTQGHPTLDTFKKQTGITVNYTEDVNDNDEFFAKIKPQLSAGQDCGRDTFCLTDWMAARLIRLGWVQELNKANIPNNVNLETTLLNVPWDKGRKYSLPWQSGFTGIGYNPKATNGKKIETVEQLLTDPSIKGRVTLLTEMRDTVGLVMLAQGKDPANFTDADFNSAMDELTKAKDAGQIKGFTGNDYTKGLSSGDIAACFAWTGDVVQLKADNPNLGYVLPATGHMQWSDNFLIPNLAQHKKNAELLINYYYDPNVMAIVEDYVNYIPPVKGTKEALLKTDPTTANNQLIFPSEATLAQSHFFMGLSPDQETKYNQAFQALIGG